MRNRNQERAIVLGGSFAGMFAARVLSEVYDEVLVVDRDRLSGVSEPRRGVPQGRHAHGLLARGQRIMENLFPGFTDGLRTAGVPVGDLNSQVRWYLDGRRLAPATGDLTLAGATRPMLEHLVRQRVAELPGVSFAEETDVVGPLASSDGRRVTGVRIHPRSGGAEQVLPAALVVDATGRGSRAPLWLTELGYPQVEEETIRIDLAYTSRRYRWHTDPFRGDMSINPVATPAHPRGAFLHTIGEDRMLISLTGVLGDHPPTDATGFLEFARSLPVPDVYEAIRDAEPLTDPVTFKYPASRRRRYERMADFPRGFLVLGDAVCSFNPVYGQGIAVSAMQAMALRKHLRGGAEPDPAAYFRDASAVLDAPWELSAGGDLAFPGVPGRRPLKVRVANAYMGRFQAAAVHDPALTAAFLRVTGLIDPPTTLMRPAVLARVLRAPRTPMSSSPAAGPTAPGGVPSGKATR
ncbi:NAD(P)/FAD-dependent oxidoreductase [Streptomyces sp. FH025]|uniref:FAD-dependent oxidoreductase n=1 Tax=Streptomyces sp. FH025 TaxID=2815937 RepID=UPI001FAF7DFC|nr:FAD-dependent monooxygenase [Streptomyces sp. FH025]